MSDFGELTVSNKRPVDENVGEKTTTSPKRYATDNGNDLPVVQAVNEEPELLELDEDEIMLRNLTDRSNNKLDIFKNFDVEKLYAMHAISSDLIKKRMAMIFSAVDEIRSRQRFDLTIAEHRAIKFLFTYIMRADGTYNDVREFDQMHHFCLISTPKDQAILDCISRNLLLQNMGGRQAFIGHFIVLMERIEAKNAQRVSFTAYRIVSPYLRTTMANKLGLSNSRTLFFREVLPKATKTHAILRGHDKYVVGHISLGEVSRGVLPNRGGQAALKDNDDIDSVAAFASAANEDVTASPRFAVYVRAYINSIITYSDDD